MRWRASSDMWHFSENLKPIHLLRAAGLSLVLVVLAASALLVRAIYRAAYRAPDYGLTPVLLVHGYRDRAAKWKPLVASLTASGYPVEYVAVVSGGSREMSGAVAAQRALEPAARDLLSDARRTATQARYRGDLPSRFDIVAQGMGVCISRRYAATTHPEMVRTWVGIAGTSQGTDVPCDISDVTTNEMRPAFEEGTGHATQIVINGPSHGLFDESPYGLGNDRSGIARVSPDALRNIAYYTIRIEPDERNASPSGTLLDGSGGVEVMIPRGVEVQETSPGNFLVRGPVDDSVLSHTNLIRLVTAILAARDGLADF
jgi:hypothetical protein